MATPHRPTVSSTPKISSRSKPLLPSSRPNVPPLPPLPSVEHSILSPKEGSTTRIKIKAAVTPDARARSTATPLKPRAGAGAGVGVGVGLGIGMGGGGGGMTPAVPGSGVGGTRPKSRLHRAITPSDSEGSLAEMLVPRGAATGLSDEIEGAVGMDFGEEVQEGETEAVLVTVRVRPPNATETQRSEEVIWETPSWDQNLIKLSGGYGRGEREWVFDRILPPETHNALAYSTSARAHVRSAMEGFNAVIFAYGQTASGKTFTLSGSPSAPGIIPLSVSDLFAQIRSTPDREFLLRVSYLELYNETILDLLSSEPGKELSLSEGRKKGEVIINGLTECAVRTEEEVRRLLKVGEDRRKVGGTDWNARSSRSHCVFRITIESRASRLAAPEEPLGARTPGGRLKAAGEKMTRISTLSIIDLAGSEKHTSSKERNAEGKHINQSLLTLKLVISKLADLADKRQVTHIPYRDSKLTRLLQPSLSGDALISVICTISPSEMNQAESLSTLAFAQGLKRVVLRAQKKEVVDPQALIQQYQNEIAELRALLREKDGGAGILGGRIGKDERIKNEAMESRLNELKSLILTSVNVGPESAQPGEARPLSPAKLKYPKLDYDKSIGKLQEDLHAADLKLERQAEEIARLKAELERRPVEVDARVAELHDEVAGLRMIADDYERGLLEAPRKVREDVEKEWAARFRKVESQLESKTIWANRLDENVRAVTAENRQLAARCKEAESKFAMVVEWVNAALLDSPPPGLDDGAVEGDEPMIVVSSPPRAWNASGGSDGGMDDFAPSPRLAQGVLPPAHGAITLSRSRMTRATLGHLDIDSFNNKFGTLTVSGKGRNGLGKGLGLGMGGAGGGGMLRDESCFALSELEESDEVF